MHKLLPWLILFNDTEIKEATMTLFKCYGNKAKRHENLWCNSPPHLSCTVFNSNWLALVQLPHSVYIDFESLETSLRSRSHLNLLELVSPPIQEIAQSSLYYHHQCLASKLRVSVSLGGIKGNIFTFICRVCCHLEYAMTWRKPYTAK